MFICRLLFRTVLSQVRIFILWHLPPNTTLVKLCSGDTCTSHTLLCITACDERLRELRLLSLWRESSWDLIHVRTHLKGGCNQEDRTNRHTGRSGSTLLPSAGDQTQEQASRRGCGVSICGHVHTVLSNLLWLTPLEQRARLELQKDSVSRRNWQDSRSSLQHYTFHYYSHFSITYML